MTLSEIAAGIEVVEEQRDRTVAAVDDTDESLAELLAGHESELPCSATEAATLLETYGDGAAVGTAALEAGVAPVTAGKALHLLGVEGVSPLSPTGRRVVRDWVLGELSRAEARELLDVGEAEFALAAFVETHDPLPDVAPIRRRALCGGDATASPGTDDRLGEGRLGDVPEDLSSY